MLAALNLNVFLPPPCRSALDWPWRGWWLWCLQQALLRAELGPAALSPFIPHVMTEVRHIPSCFLAAASSCQAGLASYSSSAVHRMNALFQVELKPLSAGAASGWADSVVQHDPIYIPPEGCELVPGEVSREGTQCLQPV